MTAKFILFSLGIMSLLAAGGWAHLKKSAPAEKAQPVQIVVEGKLLDKTAIAARIRNAENLRHDREFSGALQLLLPLAEQGDPVAQYHVGYLYDKDGIEAIIGQGRGHLGSAEEDFEQAKKWYGKSAKNGYLKAQTGLGNLYVWGVSGLRGEGVDNALGQRLLFDAAEKGDPDAAESIGQLYSQGFGGLPADRSKTIEWYKKALELGGERKLMVQIGLMYREGYLNVKKDRIEAYTWDCLGGSDDCEHIEKRLSPAEVAEVKRRVELWYASHPDMLR